MLEAYADRLTDISGRSQAIRLQTRSATMVVGERSDLLLAGLRDDVEFTLAPMSRARQDTLVADGIPLQQRIIATLPMSGVHVDSDERGHETVERDMLDEEGEVREPTTRFLYDIDTAPSANDSLKAPMTARHADAVLQTVLAVDEYDKVVSRLRHVHDEMLAEKGVPTLTIGLLLLRYRDSATASWASAPLLLQPVGISERLVRGSRSFRLKASGDCVLNEALWNRVRHHFGVELPRPDFEADPFDLSTWITALSEAITHIDAQWRVVDAQTVVNITGQKQGIRRELQQAETSAVAQGLPVLQAMRDPASVTWPPPDTRALDESFAPESSWVVVGADSSQMSAIRAIVDGGESAVIQGPPGTGKSQTITNLIASMLADGKRVLFVAAKRAALDVVARRLAEVGLSPSCLTLHADNATRKSFTDQMKAVIDETQHADDEGAADMQREQMHRRWSADLQRVRQDLTLRDQAVHAPRYGLQHSYFTLTGIWERAHAAGAAPFALGDDVRTLTREAVEAVRRDSALLERMATELGSDPSTHPYAVSPRTNVDAGDVVHLREILDRVEAVTREKIQRTETLRHLLGESAGAGAWSLEAQARIWPERPFGAPVLGARQITAWQHKGTLEGMRVARGADAVRGLSQLESARLNPTIRRYRASEGVTPAAALAADLAFLREKRHGAGKWFAWMGSEYRHVARGVQALRHPLSRAGIDDVLKHLEGVPQLLRASEGLTDADLQEFFGERLASLSSTRIRGPSHVDIGTWAERFAAHRVGPLAGALVAAETENLDALAEQLSEEAEALSGIRDTGTSLEAELESRLSVTSAVVSFGEPSATLQRTHELQAALHAWPAVSRWRAVLERMRHHPVTSSVLAQSDNLARVTVQTIDAAVSDAALQHLRREEPLLRRVGAEQSELQTQLRQLDAHILESNRVRLQRKLTLQRKAVMAGRIGQYRDVAKPRKYAGIPEYFTAHLEQILDLTPCVLMSPLTVSQYLPLQTQSGAPPFDLVVFDEASQIEVAEALPGLLRATQVVVVGDDKQMPPTSLFKEQGLGVEGQGLDLDAEESLLTRLGPLGAGLPQHMLVWHYRSRDERLIQFSNERFYKNRLETFPTPARGVQSREHQPLVWNKLDATSYQGKGRNPYEAEQVVEGIFTHLAAHPGRSLGVVTFGSHQQDEVATRLAYVRESDPVRAALLEAYDAAHPREPLFVKNLENVQGDERDHIIISFTYGPDASGTFRRQFGPLLSGPSGQRRLNVLVSRAREQMTVVSTVNAADLRRGGASAESLTPLLADFLEYVERGGPLVTNNAAGPETVRQHGLPEFDSQFEAEVYQELRRLIPEWMTSAGMTHSRSDRTLVDSQVGVGQYRIDLAVADPGNPSRYLFGVECDGEYYHGAKSARDRDLLRQQRLQEHHGWTLERIWCTDWRDNREMVLGRLRERFLTGVKARQVRTERAAVGTLPALAQDRSPRL